MRYVRVVLLGSLLLPPPGFGQSAPTDSQTLQALLAEVRQLRQDLRTTTVSAQRAQILVYRLQAQQSIVSRIQERLDNTRSRLAQIQTDKEHLAANVKQNQDFLDHADNSADRKEAEAMIPRLKDGLEVQVRNEQEAQARLIEAQEQLRIEQAKLSGLEDQLDRLEKTLESFSRQASSNPQ